VGDGGGDGQSLRRCNCNTLRIGMNSNCGISKNLN
jgi:hypothetical protein